MRRFFCWLLGHHTDNGLAADINLVMRGKHLWAIGHHDCDHCGAAFTHSEKWI